MSGLYMVSYVPGAPAHFLFTIKKECVQSFFEGIESMVRWTNIYSETFLSEEVLFIQDVVDGRMVFGYGACGEMFYDEQNLCIRFILDKGIIRRTILSMVVAVKVLNSVSEELSLVETFRILPMVSCNSVNIPGVHKSVLYLSGLLRPGTDAWYKPGYLAYPAYISHVVSEVMRQVWKTVSGVEDVHPKDFRAFVYDNGTFWLLCNDDKSKHSSQLVNRHFVGKYASAEVVHFESEIIVDPVHFVTLLAGILAYRDIVTGEPVKLTAVA